jgi:hypothetical protein
MLVRSLFRYGPKAVTGSFSRPGRGRPTNQWLVGPVAQCYKEGGGHGSQYKVHRTATHPTPQTLTRPVGALERREAPPPPPPRPSSCIRRTRCHRPTLDRIARNTVVPEPPLPPLHQAAPPLRPRPARWRPTPHLRPTPMVCAPCFRSVLLLVVLGVAYLVRNVFIFIS